MSWDCRSQGEEEAGTRAGSRLCIEVCGSSVRPCETLWLSHAELAWICLRTPARSEVLSLSFRGHADRWAILSY